MVWVKRATRWWNSTVPILASGLLLACNAGLSGDPAGKICTLVGCVGGISIDISGISLAGGYEVSLLLPTGERITQVCNGNPETGFERSCHETGAFFALPPDVPPPDQVKVEVTVAGETYSEGFAPVYERYQPNGEDCPPICYSAKLVIQVG